MLVLRSLVAQPLSTPVENDAMATSGSKWLTGMTQGAVLSTTSVATAHATPDYAMGECVTADRLTVGTDAPGASIDPTVAAGDYIGNYHNKSNSPLKKYEGRGCLWSHVGLDHLYARPSIPRRLAVAA